MTEGQGYGYETVEGTTAALRAARAHMNLSQADLAKLIGVQEATVGRHEKGENVPDNIWGRAYLLERIAAAGCPRRVLNLPDQLSLLTADNLPVEPDLLAAYLRSQAERAEREFGAAPPSDGDGANQN